ncbi:MAG: hypothetical protein NQ127_00255 [Candidatus Cardinium sp.]|nr:hypothetical protein [Candidatus Cardinium sp.]
MACVKLLINFKNQLCICRPDRAKALADGFPNMQQLHLYSDDIPCAFAKILAEMTQLRVFSNGRIGKEIGKALAAGVREEVGNTIRKGIIRLITG